MPAQASFLASCFPLTRLPEGSPWLDLWSLPSPAQKPSVIPHHLQEKVQLPNWGFGVSTCPTSPHGLQFNQELSLCKSSSVLNTFSLPASTLPHLLQEAFPDAPWPGEGSLQVLFPIQPPFLWARTICVHLCLPCNRGGPQDRAWAYSSCGSLPDSAQHRAWC